MEVLIFFFDDIKWIGDRNDVWDDLDSKANDDVQVGNDVGDDLGHNAHDYFHVGNGIGDDLGYNVDDAQVGNGEWESKFDHCDENIDVNYVASDGGTKFFDDNEFECSEESEEMYWTTILCLIL